MIKKEQLYSFCLQQVKGRKAQLLEEIHLIQQAANDDSKSSAGDKHETGRAMAHLEIEKNQRLLSETEKSIEKIQSISPDRISETIIPGSLVTTNSGIFFILISLGVVRYSEKEFIVISPESPVGMKLLGQKVGDSVFWNGYTYIIKAVE